MSTDSLTNLLTRFEFSKRLIAELQAAALSDKVLSLIFLDIDMFKSVNDTRGHSAGDAVIKAVAAILESHVPQGASAARYGGEEFAALLPGKEREEAFLLAERIRAKVEETTVEVDTDPAISVNVSGGVAAFPADAVDDSELIRMADQALYRAKSTGRNKICMAQSEKMVVKTAHYPVTQLKRLNLLAKERDVSEATLLREALDDVLIKYKVSEVES